MTEDERPGTIMEKHLVPEALVGPYGAVLSRWRRITDIAVGCGSWEEALADERHVPIGEIDGTLVWHDYSLDRTHDVLLYVVLDLLLDRTRGPNRQQWYERQAALIEKGVGLFWFALASLAGDAWLVDSKAARGDTRRFATQYLSGVLTWWPKLCQLDQMFTWDGYEMVGWPLWGGRALSACLSIGVSRADVETLLKGEPREAGDRMIRWIAEQDRTSRG